MIPIATLVLAAGRSRRMGRNKAWMLLDGEPLLSRIIRIASEAPTRLTVVVVGAESGTKLTSREAVRDCIAPLSPGTVEVVLGRPNGELIDSIRAGLAHVPADHAVLLWPVDHPFATAPLIQAMAAKGTPNNIVIPVAKGRRGHPILLGSEVVAELQGPAADKGAHGVVRRDPNRIEHIPWADERVVCDLDSPEDAQRLGVTWLRDPP